MSPLKQFLLALGLGVLLGIGGATLYGNAQIARLKVHADSVAVAARQVNMRLAFVQDSTQRVIQALTIAQAPVDTQEVTDSSAAADLDQALARAQTTRDSLRTALALAHADSLAAADARKQRDDEHQKFVTALFLGAQASKTDTALTKSIEDLNVQIQRLQAPVSLGHKIFTAATYVAAIATGIKIGLSFRK